MPNSDGMRGHVTTDSRGQWFVLTDEVDMDDAQVSGRWLKTDAVAEVQR